MKHVQSCSKGTDVNKTVDQITKVENRTHQRCLLGQHNEIEMPIMEGNFVKRGFTYSYLVFLIKSPNFFIYHERISKQIRYPLMLQRVRIDIDYIKSIANVISGEYCVIRGYLGAVHSDKLLSFTAGAVHRHTYGCSGTFHFLDFMLMISKKKRFILVA